MRESSYRCSLPQKELVITGTAELGWRWPSEHWQSPQAKKKKKIINEKQNTDANGKPSTLNHNLNYPFKHPSDFHSMYSKR